MRLAVAIPVKSFALAKARLRPALGDAARQKLAADMLRHVLAVVAASGVAEGGGVVSADPAALALGRAYGFEAIAEPAPSGYNQAAALASAWAQARRCDALLILPADLPRLQIADLEQLTAIAAPLPQCVVIAPDAAQTGTNALLLRPPDAIPFQFGLNSFHRHQQAALSRKIPAPIYISDTIAQDIDLPTDLRHFSIR